MSTFNNYTWQTCSHCWGQRQIFESSPNGEGLIPTTCSNCNGAGATIELKKELIHA